MAGCLLSRILISIASSIAVAYCSRVVTSKTSQFAEQGTESAVRNSMLASEGLSNPVADEMYEGMCPFQEWYNSNLQYNLLPQDYEYWQKLLLDKYVGAWKAAGSPAGVRSNDHNYKTYLGQGNTLGFVGAKLTVHDGPWPKHGLFAHVGTTFPAVVRFSDFGSDSSMMRLSRMAMKIPLESAWGGEVNFLLTESLDAFPIENYDELSAFTNDMKNPLRWIMNNVKLGINASMLLGVHGFQNFVLGDAFSKELLAKSFYSQVPYMLGEHQAMKFSLVPKQKTCATGEATCCLPAASAPTPFNANTYSTKRAHALATYLKDCDAKFELQLQVRDFVDMDAILRRASRVWQEAPVTVATLVIPRQKCDHEFGVCRRLQSALSTKLKLEPDGIDKAFMFHPIETHKANRPVGEINAFRAGFYSKHAKARFETIHANAFKLLNGSTLTAPARFPFDVLRKILHL
eukprot:TRINITY_DN27115_c0_g1_i1.p1 TRINITY_DN27115_c0_g1~~TRINITY_DN27115_c0_g1_i1.p1  ORF type:complete len:482 (-),score=58.50 TRINITY_DN27115_c0_g1_i1:170-1549(-)